MKCEDSYVNDSAPRKIRFGSLKENLVAFHPATNLFLNENLFTRDNHEKQIISPLYIASFLNWH